MTTNHEKVGIALNGNTLAALLVNMAQATGVGVSMIPHPMRPANPTHEPTRGDIDQGMQHEMLMAGSTGNVIHRVVDGFVNAFRRLRYA